MITNLVSGFFILIFQSKIKFAYTCTRMYTTPQGCLLTNKEGLLDLTVFPLEYPVLYGKKDFYYRAITAYGTKMIGATSPDKHNLALWHVKLKDSGVSSVCSLKPIIVVDFLSNYC